MVKDYRAENEFIRLNKNKFWSIRTIFTIGFRLKWSYGVVSAHRNDNDPS